MTSLFETENSSFDLFFLENADEVKKIVSLRDWCFVCYTVASTEVVQSSVLPTAIMQLTSPATTSDRCWRHMKGAAFLMREPLLVSRK